MSPEIVDLASDRGTGNIQNPTQVILTGRDTPWERVRDFQPRSSVEDNSCGTSGKFHEERRQGLDHNSSIKSQNISAEINKKNVMTYAPRTAELK